MYCRYCYCSLHYKKMRVFVLTRKELKDYQLIEHVVLASDEKELKVIVENQGWALNDFDVKKHTKAGIILTSVD